MPSIVELALDLHQGIGQLPQQRGGGRLVIDEGAAAAVFAQGPAQQQQIFQLDALIGQDVAGRMVGGNVEGGGDAGG